MIVHLELEFTALFGASVVNGTIHADEDEQPEVNDNGASLTIQVLVVNFVFVVRNSRVFEVRRVSSELGNSFGGLEWRFRLNKARKPLLCLRRYHSSFSRVYLFL